MSQVEQLQQELSAKLGEIEAICADYKYEASPTLLLRHSAGPSKSRLVSNDDLNKVVLCIAELGGIGEVVEDEQEPIAWRSIAVWPDTIRVGNVVGKNESDDTHDSKEQAEAVCKLLEKEGFGGNGHVFPISTRVEPVFESEKP